MSPLLVGEIQRRGEQHEIAQAVVGPQGGIDRREDGADAPAQHAELFGTGDGLDLANGSRHVLHGVVVELQILVFEARSTPVQKEYVIAAVQHKLNEAMAGTQIENVGPVHEREDQQQRNRMPLLAGTTGM